MDSWYPMPEPTRVIQLSRKKGWRKPEGAVVVARPSVWGNPYKVAKFDPAKRLESYEKAVDAYRQFVASDHPRAVWIREHVHELAGKTLACWCPQPGPCHAHVLVEMADEAVADG